LRRPRFGFRKNDINDLLVFIEVFGWYVSPQPSRIPLIVESDRPFLDAATATQSILVTGNSKHYPSSEKVMTPKEFVESNLT
jgi:hypothetical protein